MTVLVIACPHALGLAIPLVISLSTAVSAKAGILVKDRLALERMRTIDAVLFDKTGTLTTRRARGHRRRRRRRHRPRTRCCASPAASSPTASTRSPGPSSPPPANAATSPTATDFRSLTGRGVEATVDGTAYAVGGPALLRERDLEIPPSSSDTIAAWQPAGRRRAPPRRATTA